MATSTCVATPKAETSLVGKAIELRFKVLSTDSGATVVSLPAGVKPVTVLPSAAGSTVAAAFVAATSSIPAHYTVSYTAQAALKGTATAEVPVYETIIVLVE